MSVSQAAHKAEQAIGHDGSSVTRQDVASYQQTGDSSETMKALTWQGKNKVQMSMSMRWTLRGPGPIRDEAAANIDRA